MSSVLSKAPVYQQLIGELRSLAGSPDRPAGSKFLTERQVCAEFSVSRATANKALSSLVSEGLLEFRKGVGTFVRGRVLDYSLRSLVSFTEKALVAGKTPRTEVLQFDLVRARNVLDDVPEILGVGPNSGLYYMERLRLADEAPVILEKRYIVEALCPGLTRQEVSGSLYSLWVDRYQLTIESADQRIQAINARGSDARELKMRDGSAALLIQSVGYLSRMRPLWFERTLYRGDAYEFRNRLGGIQAPGPSTAEFLPDKPLRGI